MSKYHELDSSHPINKYLSHLNSEFLGTFSEYNKEKEMKVCFIENAAGYSSDYLISANIKEGHRYFSIENFPDNGTETESRYLSLLSQIVRYTKDKFGVQSPSVTSKVTYEHDTQTDLPGGTWETYYLEIKDKDLEIISKALSGPVIGFGGK